MARRQNWYLQGWEYQKVTDHRGKTKRKMVYVGVYYQINTPWKRVQRAKWICALLYLMVISIYIFVELQFGQGTMVAYVGAPLLLACIPLIYLAAGIFNLILAEEKMTLRRMKSIYPRLRIGTVASAVLFGIGTIGQVVFLIAYHAEVQSWRSELITLFGALSDTVGMLIIYWIYRKLPIRESPR